MRRDGMMFAIMMITLSSGAMGFGQTAVAPIPAPLPAPVVEPHMIAPPSDEVHQDLFGAHVQRTMTLLETSNKEMHRPVRILLYGQSIVGSGAFTKFLGTYFAQRYPYADITFENRAIGGFGGERLVRTATHDLYPFYPDLMIFHVYGGQKTGELERILSNVRRYTTSEILLFNDHKDRDHEIQVSSSSFFRYLAAKYDCELVDVSREWPRYLSEHALQPAQLLRDGVHPSVDGYAILAQLVERHLRYNPIYRAGWDGEVMRYEAKRPLAEGVEDEIHLAGDWALDSEGVVGSGKGTLHLEFEGNRVDLIAAHMKAAAGGTAKVMIDGKAPSSFVGTTYIKRPSAAPGGWFPAAMRVGHVTTLLVEDWTVKVTRMSADGNDFDFDVMGSKTGPDGSGTSTKEFRSKSGRVVIEPADWQIGESIKTFKVPAPAVGYEVHWSTVATYHDVYEAPATTDDAKVYQTTLAQGLTNGKHTLDLILNGDGRVPVGSIEVYRPPLH